MGINFKDASVLIMGSGISGCGAKFALESYGAKCFMFDDKLFATIPKVDFDYIVVSPSLPLTHKVFEFANSRNIPIIGEIELGFMFNKGQIIAITGTNGKTTVTELIGKMLNMANKKASICGNVGISFAQTAANGGYDYAVVEISSFQLETIVSFRPHIAIITNISPDHLDRHGTMASYANLKKRIAVNQTPNDYLILSQDDIKIEYLEKFCPQANVLYTSLRGKVPGAYMHKNNIYFYDELICSRSQIKLDGDHNVGNALSAICAAKLANVDNDSIIKVLGNFESDAHRIKLVSSVSGKEYYNDSKGTNIAATIKAAACMNGSTCLIAGGSYKGYEYDELFAGLPKNVTRIVAIGQTAKKIYEAGFRNKFYEITIENTLEKAVVSASWGDEINILLSPASASFDMFKNYEDRGEQFERIVKGLKNFD